MSIIEINSAQNTRVKRAAKLRTARGRRQQQRILIEGARELLRAVESGVELEELFFSDRAAVDDSLWQQLPAGAALLQTAPSVWKKVAIRGPDARVLGVARTPALPLSRLRLPSRPLVLVLESVEKPGNLGAMLRTADAAGVDAVVLADPVCDVHNPNCIRASLGAVFSLAVAACGSSEAAEFLKANGLQTVTTEVDAEEQLWEADLTGPTAVVMGSEAAGLSALWGGAGRRPIRLPMRGRVDSLNVSAAAAVVLYEAMRQRQSASP